MTSLLTDYQQTRQSLDAYQLRPEHQPPKSLCGVGVTPRRKAATQVIFR